MIREYNDYVYARNGRLILRIGTAAPAANLSYDVQLAGWIMQLPSTVRAARPEGWNPSDIYVQKCKKQASHQAHLGAPIIYTRGSYTAVLFVDTGDDYTFFCSWAPRQSGTSDGQPAFPGSDDDPLGLEVAPPAIGIQDRQGGNQTCDSPPSPNLGEMYGFVGSDVIGATFEFVHDPPIKAVVERGFYIASWPYASWPDAVALKTKSGITVTRAVPDTGGCGNGVARPHKKTSRARTRATTPSRNGATIVVVVVRTRNGTARRATTFTTRGAAEISPGGVERSSVATASFMARGFESMSSGGREGIYDPTNNTVYETNWEAELGASMQQLRNEGTQLRQRLNSSHPSAQASQRTMTTIGKPHSKLYDSLVGMTEPGLDGLSDMFVPHVGRHERVVARVFIDGHPALKLAPAWYMTDLGAIGEVGGYGTMYVTPGTYEPVRDVLPNGKDTVINNWLSYRVLPATRANLKLVSLTALHPGARVSHSATGFLRAQKDATNQ